MQTLADELRRTDPDRYLSTLYAPADRRADLTALFGFNAEIARIRDVVREPGLGEIRLQWWDDLLSTAGAAQMPADTLAGALQRTIERHHLPPTAFRNMLDARRFDLYQDVMPTVNDLEGYCGETAGTLLQLASLVLDAEAAADLGDIAGHGGCAQAMTGLLALLPRHRARQQCYLPRNLLDAAGAEPADLFAEQPGDVAAGATAAMIALARDHLSQFERLARNLPPGLRSAYLPVALVRPWLAKIERAGPGVFQHSIELPPLRRHIVMAWRAARGWR